ncbi:MAG TPA: choice-of-anchor Q domain-containing protein [Rhodanobacteraceae bacterium]|nr:choice-of-anchor Q domain-containing protein [Rhodanobacteraceae bacterium]
MKRRSDRNPLHVLSGAAFALLLSLLAFSPPVTRAATVCVNAGDIVGLQTALANAANNSEDDVIELEVGEYSMPGNFPLYYSASAEVHSLTIEGGYSADFSGPCGSPPTVPDAALTVLDGGIFRIHMAGAGSFTLRGITIQNTFSTDPLDPPVEIGGYNNATGTFTVQHAMFLGNSSTTKAAVYIFAGDGGLFIQDALFANNQSTSASESAVHVGSLSTGGSFCTVILNSTFANNSSPMAPALDVHTQMCDTLAANDIFWHGVAGAVQFDVPQSTYLANDDFNDLSESANAAQASALLSVDPLFYPDYSLHDLSPLRDKGFAFSLESYDVVGYPRVDGANPDIGAFETHDVIFANGFEL